MIASQIEPGQKVRVIQSIQTRQGPWETTVEGEVVSNEMQPTGSWFAHGKGDKLWLRRLRLRRQDGELVELNIDDDSVVTILD